MLQGEGRAAARGGAAMKLVWGLTGVVGYILSPLSPWNDAFVNVPIAYAFARLLSSLGVPKPLGFYAGYTASNIAGLVLLATSIEGARRRVRPTCRELARVVAVSTLYSLAAYTLLTLLGLL